MNKEKLNKLRESIFTVFPQTEPLDSEQITTHKGCCEDGDVLVNGFSNVKWWEVDKSVVSYNHGNLPLFEDKPYHYFFPAFLLNALEDFTGYNEVLQFLVYALEPLDDSFSAEQKSYFESRNQLFSSEQVNVIVSFLELVLENKNQEMSYRHQYAKRALKYWKSRQFAFRIE
jgi:hypothetical protein